MSLLQQCQAMAATLIGLDPNNAALAMYNRLANNGFNAQWPTQVQEVFDALTDALSSIQGQGEAAGDPL